MENQIFLIERIWISPIENEYASALGYEPYGFINTHSEAMIFCDTGKKYTQKDCWAISGEMPEYKFKPLAKVIL